MTDSLAGIRPGKGIFAVFGAEAAGFGTDAAGAGGGAGGAGAGFVAGAGGGGALATRSSCLVEVATWSPADLAPLAILSNVSPG